MSALAFIIAGMLAAATPLILAAVGEMVAERTGVLNLGIEGMMALGAAVAFIVVTLTGSHLLGFAAAAVAGALLAMVFALLALGFLANQVAAGLGIGVMGQGLSALVGKEYESRTVRGLPDLHVPGLSDIPFLGRTLFSQDIVVWLTIFGAVAIWVVLNRTRAGLVIRAVGENPHAARAVGFRVIAIRTAALAFGGAMAGIAGAYASTVLTTLWAEGMIAGRGWIAVALVVFGTWRTGRVAFGAVLFGALSLGELALQAAGVPLSSQVLASVPYAVTILMLVVISSDRRRMAQNSVASLGQTYHG